MLDESSIPLDREGRERFITELQEAIAVKVRAALRRIIGDAVGRFTDSLTASGDLSQLDSIPDAWLTFVSTDLADDLGNVYQAGQMTAWLGLKNAPSDKYAASWAAVANENAVSYVRDATNRLAGVGDNTWQLVRAQTTSATAKGMSTEDLKEKIEGITGFSEFRADTIARTETVGAYVQGDLAGARALGDVGPVEKVWVAALDQRTRESHAAAHNQTVPLDGLFDLGGIATDGPHSPGLPPGEVVNCRCYVEMLYPGDTRPDGSIVEGGEPEPDPAWEPEPFAGGDLSLARNQPELGGAHRKSVLLDDDGNQFLFKPQDEWVARGEAAASEIGIRAGLNVPRIHLHTFNGEVGTLQRMVPGARNGFPGPASGFDPTKVTRADLATLQQHRALDWMIGNHDAHAGQFIRQGYATSGGELIGIDKGQAFKHFGNDKLDRKYHPNGKFGEAAPVYNRIEDAYADGSLPDGAFTSYAKTKPGADSTIGRLMAIPDDEYRSILTGYARGRYASDPAGMTQFLDAAVTRKNQLAADMAKYHRSLDTARAKALAARNPPARAVALDGSAGGPQGMTGALPSQPDTRWMEQHDSPLTKVDAAPTTRWYTEGSWSINDRARQGLPDERRTKLDAELGTIKTPMTLTRGTNLGAVLPPGGHSALQGAVFVDRAYLSTAAGGSTKFSGDTLLTIRANAGARGSYVKPISAFPRENEVLLGRETHLYVHKVVDQGNGRFAIEAETVTREWAEASGTKVWDTGSRSWR